MKTFLPLLPLFEYLVGPDSHYQDPKRRTKGHKDPPPKATDGIGFVKMQGLTWQQAEAMLALLKEIKS